MWRCGVWSKINLFSVVIHSYLSNQMYLSIPNTGKKINTINNFQKENWQKKHFSFFGLPRDFNLSPECIGQSQSTNVVPLKTVWKVFIGQPQMVQINPVRQAFHNSVVPDWVTASLKDRSANMQSTAGRLKIQDLSPLNSICLYTKERQRLVEISLVYSPKVRF